MPKQFDLFTGAPVAPKTKTQKTKKEHKTMKTKSIIKAKAKAKLAAAQRDEKGRLDLPAEVWNDIIERLSSDSDDMEALHHA